MTSQNIPIFSGIGKTKLQCKNPDRMIEASLFEFRVSGWSVNEVVGMFGSGLLSVLGWGDKATRIEELHRWV